MKKLTLIVALIAILGFAGPAAAQQEDENPFSFGVKAGWFWFQDDPFSDVIENNWVVGGDVTYWFPQGFGIGAEVQFTTTDDDGADFNGMNVDYEFTQVPINANVYYRFPIDSYDNDTSFYVGAGASFIFTDLTLDYADISIDTDDTVIGFNAKAGVQYGLFFVEGQWTYAEWDDEAVKGFFNEDDDINVGGFSGWVGIRF